MGKTASSSARTRPIKKPTTLHDVAREAGVSIATVSNVLNGSGSVGQEVSARVRQIAERLQYRQNRAAKATKTGRSEIIGLVIPNMENPFFATLSRAVLMAAQYRGYQVFITNTEGSHESQYKMLLGLAQQGVDGIVIFPVDESQDIGGMDIGIPLLVLDRKIPGIKHILVNTYRGGCLLAEHLLALGHKRYGLLEGPQNISSSKERSKGVMETIGGYGDIVWKIAHPYQTTLTTAARALLKQRDVTAVICGNDLIAIAAISHLQASQIRVPGEVSVVGFDDIRFASVISPALTTVRMPMVEMAHLAVSHLIECLRNGEDSGSPNQCILDVELVVRDSTALACD